MQDVARSKIFSLVNYVPTEAQFIIHQDQSRNKLIAGGERAGKSKVNSKELLSHYAWDFLAEKKRDGLYWLLGNDYEACRGEWEHILADFQTLELIKSVTRNIDPGEILLTDGTRIITKSARYPEKIATVAPDGILICEAAQIDYDTFLRVVARTAETRGWVCMAGTFEQQYGAEWYRKLFLLGQSDNNMELMSFSLPTWSNTIKFPGGRNDPEILKQEAKMPQDRFMERFGGEPCPPSHRVIPEFSNKIHVKDIPFNRDLSVTLAIDPGFRGAACVTAIQDYGDYQVGFDEVYLTGTLLKDIILIVKQKPWYRAVDDAIIDIAARAHQDGREPAVEIWEKETEGFISPRSNRLRNEEYGIDLLRVHLQPNPITGLPLMYVTPNCRGFIAECGGGESPVDGGGVWVRDKNTQKPEDRNDHACNTWMYYLLDKFGFRGEFKRPPPLSWGGTVRQKTFQRT